MHNNKAVIIVRYENDAEIFIKNMFELSKHLKVYIYDNSKENISMEHDNIYYYHDGSNGGLAKAINHSIDVAIADNKEYAVYFDQDSTINILMIKNLFNSYDKLKQKYSELFVIGPQPVMVDNSNYPVRALKEIDDNYFTASEIITSGMTFKLSDIKDIGYFSLELFLDMVDFEICWRARDKGMKIVIDKKIKMVHEVGTNTIKIPFKILPISSPIRNYYQMRNVLYCAMYQTKKSKLTVAYYMLRRFVNVFINILFVDNRLLRLKYNYQGFIDAFKKNMGKYNR